MITAEYFQTLYDLPKAQEAGLSREAIETIADRKREEWAYSIGKDLKPIVAQQGGRIFELDTEDWLQTEEASVAVYGRRNFEIFIASFVGTLRARFSVAHELGHYVLHSKEGERPLRAARSGRNNAEREANCFAAAFLMPRDTFTEYSDRLGSQIYALAGIFGVSPSAVQVRKRTLGT